MAKVKDKGSTYEALYEMLLVQLDKLENGNLTLDQSLQVYKEAMDIADQCQKQLENAKQTLETIEKAGEMNETAAN